MGSGGALFLLPLPLPLPFLRLRKRVLAPLLLRRASSSA